jgi:rSAM/selenodomain-associated transferase 2
MTFSIIIPTFNESKRIGKLIRYLIANNSEKLIEIIVADGGSTDDSVIIAQAAGAKVVVSPEKGRAAQMNHGASLASGDILYFVHADTMPPKSFIQDIVTAINQGYNMGRYLSSYESKSLMLKLNALLSRLDVFGGMGGDQTLFITSKLFWQIEGFNSSMQIMEEFEFCSRARKAGRYKIIKKPVLISARKYETNGWLKVQRANYTIVRMYLKGAAQESMVETYRKMLDYR